jgi:precorrin-6x reductase
MTHHILILGGTLEARQLAARLEAERRKRQDFDIILSLAGRTKNPLKQPVPVRIGGFGGVDGLAAYLKQEQIDLLIDATHPYAASMSHHAAYAAEQTGTRLIAFRRPPWEPLPDDLWQNVPDVEGAVAALDTLPRKIFVALGRKELLPFEKAPWHHYIVRSVDPVEPPLNIPDVQYILDRGPFEEDSERKLLMEYGIECIISKNSGGPASYGKITAARQLKIPVIMIERPALPFAETVETLDDALSQCLQHVSSAFM